jgi:ABC-2 type transport system permease protein
LFLRRKDDVFWTLAYPVFMMVFFGLIYGDQFWAEYGMRAIDYVTPGLLILGLMVTGVMTTASGFAEEREKGIYRRLSLTPLKRSTLIGGQIVHRYLVIITQTALLLLTGILAFKVKISGNYLLFSLLMTCGALCFLSMGFALTGFIRTARSATPICMTVFFVLMFLGSIFFPLAIMPGFLKVVSNALPSTHLGDALRLVIINGGGIGEVWKPMIVVGAWTVGCLVITLKFFRWQ